MIRQITWNLVQNEGVVGRYEPDGVDEMNTSTQHTIDLSEGELRVGVLHLS